MDAGGSVSWLVREEDGISKLTLEDSSGSLLLEESSGQTPPYAPNLYFTRHPLRLGV